MECYTYVPFRIWKDPLGHRASLFVLEGTKCHNLSLLMILQIVLDIEGPPIFRFYLAPSGMRVFYQGLQNGTYLLFVWHDQYNIIDIMVNVKHYGLSRWHRSL